MELLSRKHSLVEVAELFRNIGNRYPKTTVRWKLCSLVCGKIANSACLSTRKREMETEQREPRMSEEDPSASNVDV